MAPTATKNFYQPDLVKMYCDNAIMEAWLSFHDITTVQNCEARALDYLEPLQVQSHPLPKFYILKWDGTEPG